MTVLQDELTNDPLARGYSTMSDAEVATSLNTVNRDYTQTTLTGNEILHGIVPSEYSSLPTNRPDTRTTVMGIVGVDGEVSVAPGSFAREAFIAIFGSGSGTIAALAAMLSSQRSRAEELGLGGVSHTDVAIARGRTG